MELLVFLLAAISAIAILSGVNSQNMTPEQQALFNEMTKSCMREHNVSEEDVERLRKEQYDNTNHNVKCFLRCYGEKTNVYVNGKINTEVVRNLLGGLFGKDKIEGVMEDCNSIQDSDNCERAFQLFRCYKKHQSIYI